MHEACKNAQLHALCHLFLHICATPDWPSRNRQIYLYKVPACLPCHNVNMFIHKWSCRKWLWNIFLIKVPHDQCTSYYLKLANFWLGHFLRQVYDICLLIISNRAKYFLGHIALNTTQNNSTGLPPKPKHLVTALLRKPCYSLFN